MGRLARHRKVRADDVFNTRRGSKSAEPAHMKKGKARRDMPANARSHEQRPTGLKRRFHDMLALGAADKGGKRRKGAGAGGARVMAPPRQKKKAAAAAAGAASSSSSSSSSAKASGEQGDGEGEAKDVSRLRFKTKRRAGESFRGFSQRLDAEAREIIAAKAKANTVSDRRKRYLTARQERLRKQKRKKRGDYDSDEEAGVVPDVQRREHVEFGDVVERPPEIKQRPRQKRAPNAAVMARAKQEEEDAEDSGAADDARRANEAELYRQRIRDRQLELERDRAMLAYKNSKKSRRAANPRGRNEL